MVQRGQVGGLVMEFHEKLQELRKNRGLTQEELAEALYVSRTAISKWESGRGYPSIDSLKEISNFFSVTIDDLLSTEKILSIAERENKSNLQNMRNWFIGIVDVASIMLIVLPLYPNEVNSYVYSVNLFTYTQTTAFNRFLYWGLFLALIIVGIAKLFVTKYSSEKINQKLTGASLIISVITVIFLALTREAYAVVVAFLLLIIKGAIKPT